MGQRTFLKNAAMTGALFITAGCMDGDSESQPTTDIETGNETGNSTTSETMTEAGPAEVPSPKPTFRANSDVLCIVHMGDEKITDEGANEICVTVDDERTMTWIVGGDKGREFPVSVGNFLEIESAENDSTVEVVQVGSEGAEKVLVTHEVGAGETATTTITNETATSETTTSETATNETTTTTATKTTISSGNEANN